MASQHYYSVLSAYALVCNFFGNDHDKAMLWFCTENILLGSQRPVDMLRSEHGTARLLAFIRARLSENTRP